MRFDFSSLSDIIPNICKNYFFDSGGDDMKKSTFVILVIVLIVSCITINAAIIYKIVSTSNSIEQGKQQIHMLKAGLNK